MNKKLILISIMLFLLCVQVVNASPPTTATDPATSIFAAKATLNGTVNPNGLSTTYYFEYGETDTYGNTTEENNLNNVSIDIEVNAEILGLSASTIYHYRLVATNADGTNYGDDSTFATKPAYIIDAFPSPYSDPTGLTFDGEFYWVVDDWPNWAYQRIYQIDTDGNEISSFQTEAGESTSGGMPQGLHFDGTYLWLADPRNDRFIQYDTAGNEILTINSPASFPTGLTFDGTFFWNADSDADEIYKLDMSGNPVDWFYSPGNNPKGLEFDGTYLWVADSDADRIFKLDTSGNVLEIMFSPGAYPSGLAFDGTFLWNSDYLDGQIYKIDPTLIPASTPPLVTTDSANSISSVAAQLNGTLNPNGLNTSYHFEYGTSISYGMSTNATGVSAGINNVAVNANLTNLLPDTTYHFRLVAENSEGIVHGDDRIFTTLDILDPPELSVTPEEGFQSSGFLGGPFTPSSKIYTLENTGQVALDWTASKSKHWVDLSGQAGTLNPGETITVEISINDSANSLVQDTYTDSVIFLNTTNGIGNTGRSVVLSIVKTPSTISCNLSTSSMMMGSSLTVSGLIDPSPTAAGAWVDILLTPPSAEEIHIPVEANALGQFSKTLVCHQVDQAGVWLVQTSWNGDEQYTGATSSPRPLSVSKAASSLTLDMVTADAIKINSTPPIGGKFSTTPSCEGLNLQDTPITLRITEPDAEEHLLAATVNQNGQFLLDYNASGFAFEEMGEWTIEALFEGDDNFMASSSDVITVRVVPTAGYAVIVQGKSMSEEGLASHIKTTNFVYEKLIERQLLADDIAYFGWDSSNPAVDAQPFKSAIQTTLTETMRDKMIANAGDLYIVMVNHGWTAAADSDVGEFNIAPDSPLTSTDLSAWLDVLQSALQGTAAENQKIILILGFCRAGAFIDDIYGNSRVVIASAASNEYSHRGPQDVDEEGQPLRDGEYFVSEFFKSVSFGKSVKQCFKDATELTEAFTSSGSGEVNAPYYDDSVQHPLLDDNSNGVGSNELSSVEGEDGYDSEYLFIGASPSAGNDPGDVLVIHVNPAQFLGTSDSTVDLWAEVDDPDDLRLIWIEVKAPNYNPEGPGAGFQIVMDTFKKATTDVTGNRYEWTSVGGGTDPADLFDAPGAYQIFYFAKDNNTGHVSPLMQSRVYKALAGNSIPNEFDLLIPDPGETILTTTILDWEDAIDPDGHSLMYTVLLSKNNNQFMDPIFIEGLTNSEVLISAEDGIEDLSTYYWKVRAIDPYGAYRETSIRLFTTDNTNPVAGWIEGFVYDATTDQAITSATININNGSLILNASLNGHYLGALSPGNYPILVTAAGFQDASGTINIPEGSTVSRNFGMMPAIVDTEPVATISSPGSDVDIIEGESVNFQGGVTDGNAPFTYAWDFNGGATNVTVKDPGNITFMTAGVYVVRFTVTDNDNDSDYDEVTITVTEFIDDVPIEAIIISPSSNVLIYEGESVNFQGSASGGMAPYSYSWDFDGGADNSTEMNPGSVIFNMQGVYIVTFTVTDFDNNSDYDTVTVTVESASADTDGDGEPDISDTDDDNDGLPDTEEYGLDGNDTAYDGNSDGTPDNLQANVASFHTHNLQSYVTLETPDNTEIFDCQASGNPSPADAPEDVEFDHGFFTFIVEGLTPGASTTVTMHFPEGSTFDTYYKYGPTPDNTADHWYEFLYDNFTGAQINDHVITLHFVDALRGDDVLTQDSMVIDLGAPARTVPSDDGDGGGDDGGGGGCFIDTLGY